MAGDGVILWDIAGQGEIEAWNGSGPPGSAGEIWYVRLLPPYAAGSRRAVTLATPYVFRDSARVVWEALLQRQAGWAGAATPAVRDYLKEGKVINYWLEYLFQAYAGHTGNMVLVTGVPDVPASLPHSSLGPQSRFGRAFVSASQAPSQGTTLRIGRGRRA